MTQDETRRQRPRTRREFLQLLGAGAGALTLGPYGLAKAAEEFGPASTSRSYALDVSPMRTDLGGRKVSTIGYNGALPGPLLRVTEGDRLKVQVSNHLNTSTSVHWHGIPIVNKMDGVPGLTQAPIAAGANFLYDFKVPVAGTYWYHSHSAAQMDRGMYGPLIVDAKHERVKYDREIVIVLDDWRDGIGGSIRDLASLYECQIGFQKHLKQAGGPPPEPDRYPLHLINGRSPHVPAQFALKRGEVIRLRLINAGSATTYRVALSGHRMRVIYADGQPVAPVDIDSLDIGMAERYDVLIYATNPGVWQLAAQPSTPGPTARAVFRYNGHRGAARPANFQPGKVRGTLLNYGMLRNAGGYGVPSGKPDITIPITLNSRFGAFYMQFNGQIPDSTKPFHIPRGSHVRFVISNESIQVHPMHLHGHFFQLANGTGHGPMKDTLTLAPSQTYTVDWIADNPGLWVYHCHNLYHMLNGLMQTFKVG